MGAVSIPPDPVPMVEDLVSEARRTPAEDFVRRFGRMVLVGPRPAAEHEEFGDEDEEDDPWSYQTIASPLGQAGNPLALFRESEVYGIKKAPGGAFANTILVGRSSSNDVTVPDASLSKLHARIRVASDGTLTVSDSGSKNGSLLNNQPLGGDARPLGHGDLLQLGNRSFKVFETARFHGMVRKLL